MGFDIQSFVYMLKIKLGFCSRHLLLLGLGL